MPSSDTRHYARFIPSEEVGDVTQWTFGTVSAEGVQAPPAEAELPAAAAPTVEEMTAVRALRERNPVAGDILTTAIWSGKEAVLKALREGLRIDTRRMTCRFDAFDEPPQEWTPFTVAVDDGLALQFPGVWAGWWRADGRYVYSMALLEAEEVSSDSTRS